MKALITAIALLGACSAFADEPRGMRTPNGGYEYYTNSGANAGLGSVETGCYLHWSMAGRAVLGYNPKRVDTGEQTEFVDCKIPAVVIEHKHHRHYAEPVAPVYVAPVPAPVPAPLPPVDSIRE